MSLPVSSFCLLEMERYDEKRVKDTSGTGPFFIRSSLLKIEEDDNMVEDDNIVKDTSGTCPFLSRVVCLFVAFGGSLTVAHCSTAV